MRVTFLGMCANQTATHEAVSFIVDAGDYSILIDAGPGVVRQILRARRFCTEIAHVLVTHIHGDHSLGFPYFVWNHFYEGMAGRKGPDTIHVYAFASVICGLNAMLDACYGSGKYPFSVTYHEVPQENAGEFEIGDISVRTVPVDHTVPNFGFRMDYIDRSLAYSSDTIYSDAFTELAHGVDLMIHEAFITKEQIDFSRKVKHATAADAGNAAREATAGELALVHVYPPYLERIQELIDEARAQFSGEVYVPSELQVISV